MKIDILDKDYLLTHITVRVFEDDELVHCNHANLEIADIDFGDELTDDIRTVYTCDRCDYVETMEVGDER